MRRRLPLALIGLALIVPVLARGAYAQSASAAPDLRPSVDPVIVASVDTSRSAQLEAERRKNADELAALSRSITLSKDTIRSLNDEIDALAKDRDRIRQAMIDAAAAQKSVSDQLAKTEKRVSELATEEGSIKASLRERRGVLAEVLAALERMGRKPPPAILVEPQDALSSVRSAILLGAVVPSIRHETDALVGDLERLSLVRGAIDSEKKRFAAEVLKHREEGARLAGLFAEKQRLEETNRRQREAEQTRAAELAGKASDLEGLIASLEKDAEAAKAAETAAAAQARQQAEVAARQRATQLAAEALDPDVAPASPASPDETEGAAKAPSDFAAAAPTGANMPDGETGDLQVAALDPQASALSPQDYDIDSLRRDSDRLAPAAPFSTMKGRLSKPVAGRQVMTFGATDDIGRATTGVSIAARPGDVVTAPADANVLYSGPFRSYGQLLILDAGDGYHVVLAGMDRIDVETGQFVSAGEPVATMGAQRVASVAMAEFGASEPTLYVEFRKDGKPVDPSPWWMDEPSGRTRNDP